MSDMREEEEGGDLNVYLASPRTQQQAEHVSDMPVLLSYACFSDWLYKYQQTFSRILIDSGAFSELNSGIKVDLQAYADWADAWRGHADAIAGLDDISGDYHRSLRNYEAIPWTFPTWHDTDPLELIPELVAMSYERKQNYGKCWLGIGLNPPRQGKRKIVLRALELIPADIHIHGWAMREYAYIRRFDSMDSTNWWRDAMGLRTVPGLKHLTYGETLEIVVKRYQRAGREITNADGSNRAMASGDSAGLATQTSMDSVWQDAERQREELV